MDKKVLEEYVKAQRAMAAAEAAVEGEQVRQHALHRLTGGEMGEAEPPQSAEPWLDEGTKRSLTALFAALGFSLIMVSILWAVGFEGAPKGGNLAQTINRPKAADTIGIDRKYRRRR